jgi:bifunctional DNase/RNase
MRQDKPQAAVRRECMAKPDDVLVEVKGLVPTQTGCGVFLANGGKIIAIFVDHSVAAAITMFLHGIKKPRPLTHDLIANIFAGVGAKVQKVVVNDLKDDTFFARLYLLQENELGRSMVEIDARPSDSIAIALQQGCPIYVSRAVWERAEDMTWALEQASSESPGSGEEDDEQKTGEDTQKG